MSQTFELEFCGTPAGTGAICQSEDGWWYVWTRPDGVSEFKSCQSEQDAGEMLMDRVIDWYGSLQ